MTTNKVVITIIIFVGMSYIYFYVWIKMYFIILFILYKPSNKVKGNEIKWNEELLYIENHTSVLVV